MHLRETAMGLLLGFKSLEHVCGSLLSLGFTCEGVEGTQYAPINHLHQGLNPKSWIMDFVQSTQLNAFSMNYLEGLPSVILHGFQRHRQGSCNQVLFSEK